MEYAYTLNNDDLKVLNINDVPLNENQYCEIVQNGWTCHFKDMYSVIENEYGFFKDQLIIKGKNLTEKQQDYIINNCKHVEY